jgi:fructose-1-phosphate kinase PfkB-like protein
LFESNGVDTSGVDFVSNEKTFFWSGRYLDNFNDRITIETQLNVLTKFKPVVPNKFLDASIVLLGNLDPNLQLDVLNQMKNPKFVIMDTMNFWIEGYRVKLDEIISKVDLISVNEEEARQLTDSLSLIDSANKLQAMGPKNVIIKKGEHGAILFSDKKIFQVPAFPLKKIFDPTGAGDSFIGGFAGSLSEKKQLSFQAMKTAAVKGSAIASFTVQQFGTKELENLTFRKLNKRIKEFKSLTNFEI